jgi:Diacylglycerol kinase catalytic domain
MVDDDCLESLVTCQHFNLRLNFMTAFSQSYLILLINHAMPLIVLYNPVSGDRNGAKLTTETILPLLVSHNLTPDTVTATEHVGHAGTLLVSYIESLTPSARAEGITLVLVSGDGTLHEIVNALYSARANAEQQDSAFPSIRIVLIPGGTANALHATFFPPSPAPNADPTLLASLLSFLSATPRLVPLTFAYTTISPPSNDNEREVGEGEDLEPPPPSASESILSVVVTSTALHASILHDSEALRASMPGIERFKLAAAQNATTWYRARARLLAPVQRYDVASGTFVSVTPDGANSDDDELLSLPGPFAYFLSTVNVDRLEPFFRIAPLQRALPPPPDAQTMDVLAVRPLRDASLGGKSGDGERERFKEILWDMHGGAYRDGTHIHTRYNTDALGRKIDGQPVVEYFRVGGWEWIPVGSILGSCYSPCLILITAPQEEDDEKAHLLCADGKIFHAPKGGKFRSNVLARTAHDLEIALYA